MKATSQMSRSVIFTAILTCVMLAGAGSALAQQTFRNDNAQTFTNTCANGNDCGSWGESVSVTEGASLAPIVVTWSARYFVNTADIYYVGLNVNGTGCFTDLYGPTNLDDIATKPSGHFLTVTFQWVVEPSDGVLIKGVKNTFELCGGGDGSVSGDSINISQNTLTALKD